MSASAPFPKSPSPVGSFRRQSLNLLNFAQHAPQRAKNNVDWINPAGPANKIRTPFPLFQSTVKSRNSKAEEVGDKEHRLEDLSSSNYLQFAILALPRELRDHIYSFVWPTETPEEIFLSLTHPPITPSLCRTSQQLRMETLPYFIQEQVFNVRASADLKDFREWLDGSSNKWNFNAYSAIRHLRFIEWSGRGSWLEGGNDGANFLKRCPNIRTLEINVPQDVNADEAPDTGFSYSAAWDVVRYFHNIGELMEYLHFGTVFQCEKLEKLTITATRADYMRVAAGIKFQFWFLKGFHKLGRNVNVNRRVITGDSYPSTARITYLGVKTNYSQY
ncbi:hypothetical protein BU16DRAFT_541440 [Lophium mytilinum]|uniref:F-box domain-containing protein n=1 Tax=Lophium mytilinum TaxID=390894 RepID=A0A6A6QJL0_9PEZI|nr:hypothetical protein BU16DRAFT_541440 [Lophium mytilinum]